ncbi:glucosamine-6-phosphate deaminase [Aeromicrobium sp. CTD01-1L150]|uniref:glucosamine-6-phosphate deaminase n=1 Tax=Aeromicrobium sp. CTD01-1L150 TaxID=3341830 RepID=UPI0035C15B85
MEIVVAEDPQDCAARVADIVTATISQGGRALGLATGSSPLAVYTELIRRHREEGLSFAGATAALLDEYVGLPPDHPRSYRRIIREVFTQHVDIDDADVLSPDGSTGDAFAAAASYEQVLKERGPVDVQLLGIGTNGHLGFNEPTSSLRSRTRVKTLTSQTRRDNARFFDRPDDVPLHVITQGLGTISDARRLVLIATGEHKAAAVAAAVEGPLSARCPASVLQLHPAATVVVDGAAASRLELIDYYREVALHRTSVPGADRDANRA